LVHRITCKWTIKIRGKTLGDIACVQHGCLSRLAQPIPPVSLNIRQCPDHHSKVTKECLNTTDALWLVKIELINSVLLNHSRHRQKRFEFRSATTWSASWSATAMRGGKCLVKVQVDYVNAHITWPRDANQSVHICAVHINQAAGVVHDRTDFLNVFFKQTQR